ncbi:MAG: glycoside hydrolase family 3 protein [Anaerolineae bacterium]
MTQKNIEDKVGQMLMGGFHGLTAPDYFLDWLREGRLGGVILFARNVRDPQQLADLTASLHTAAKYPLLIAIDQEGGTVARLREGFAESPGALALSSIPHQPEATVETVSGVLAQEMRALGINWTYAPVMDITYNTENPTVGTRSFGTDPEQVGVLAAAAVRGFQQNGVAACAKHFPGLGNTAMDTHLALPSLDTSVEELQIKDLLPYRIALESQLATIMTTHTIFNRLDTDHPATLSGIIIQELIRKHLRFEGVVTTDCMEMKAIDDHYGVKDSVVRAVLAGVDIVLFSHTAEKQAAAYEHLLAAVQRGDVPMDIIDTANRRIEALKAQFPAHPVDLSQINTPEHHETMLAAAKAAMTQFRADERALPLTPEQAKTAILIEFSPQVESIVEETVTASTLSYYVREHLPTLKTLVLPVRPSEDEIANVLRHEAALWLIATRNAHLNPAQSAAVHAIHAAVPKTVLLALRNPYDARLLPDSMVLCSAGDSRPSLEALSMALRGEFVPAGQVRV